MIGVCITTYNSENYFKTLFDSLPKWKIDHLVIVNGGDSYLGDYSSNETNVKWIQHSTNKGPAQSRNDGLSYLYAQGCDYLFIIEDDMIVISENIFDEYIKASTITGLSYFCFVSYAWEVGPRFARTPRLKIGYSPDLTVNLYKNSCNEFTFRTREMFEKTQPFDINYYSMFDVDNYYKITQQEKGHCFWYSPDLAKSDTLIMNNPDALSRLDSDGKRMERLSPDFEYFKKTHGLNVIEIFDSSPSKVVEKLKNILDNVK